MRIKTITADNMAEALKIIRDQLGPEALILGTRKVKNAQGQPTLEITAALNEPDIPAPPMLAHLDTPASAQSTAAGSLPAAAPTAPDAPLPNPSAATASLPFLPYAATSGAPRTIPLTALVNPAKPAPEASPVPPKAVDQPATISPRQRSPLHTALDAHSIPPDLTERLLTAMPALQQAGFSSAEALEMLLGKLLRFNNPQELLPRGHIHVFIGPTGAGKTTLIAKLAIQAHQSGTSVALMSLDDQKIAGFEPLAVAAEALGEQAHLISSPEDLTRAAHSLGPRQLVFIDTPGLNPFQRHGILELHQRLQSLHLPYTVHLVAPAYLHAGTLAGLPQAFAVLNPASFIATKIDETSHFGPLVAALATPYGGAPLRTGLASNHPSFTQPPMPLGGRWLAETLVQPPRQLFTPAELTTPASEPLEHFA